MHYLDTHVFAATGVLLPQFCCLGNVISLLLVTLLQGRIQNILIDNYYDLHAKQANEYKPDLKIKSCFHQVSRIKIPYLIPHVYVTSTL